MLRYRPRIVQNPIAVLLTLALTLAAALAAEYYDSLREVDIDWSVVGVLAILYPGLFLLIRARADYAVGWSDAFRLAMVAAAANAGLLCFTVPAGALLAWLVRAAATADIAAILAAPLVGAAQGLCFGLIERASLQDRPPLIPVVSALTLGWAALAILVLFGLIPSWPFPLSALGALLVVAPHAALVPAVNRRQP